MKLGVAADGGSASDPVGGEIFCAGWKGLKRDSTGTDVRDSTTLSSAVPVGSEVTVGSAVPVAGDCEAAACGASSDCLPAMPAEERC